MLSMETSPTLLIQYVEYFKSELEANRSQFQIHKAIFKLVSKRSSGKEQI